MFNADNIFKLRSGRLPHCSPDVVESLSNGNDEPEILGKRMREQTGEPSVSSVCDWALCFHKAIGEFRTNRILRINKAHICLSWPKQPNCEKKKETMTLSRITEM